MHLTWSTILFEILLTFVIVPSVIILNFHYTSSLFISGVPFIWEKYYLSVLNFFSLYCKHSFQVNKLISIISICISMLIVPSIFISNKINSYQSYICVHCLLGGSTSIFNVKAISQHLPLQIILILIPSALSDGIRMNQFFNLKFESYL